MMLSSQGNPFTYSSHNLFAKYILRYFFNKKICFHGTHTATDIYSYRVGDYYSFRCQYTTYRHTFTPMCIGHQCKVMKKERQCCQVVYFFPGMCIQLVYPEFYGYIVHCNNFHISMSFKLMLQRFAWRYAMFLRSRDYFSILCVVLLYLCSISVVSPCNLRIRSVAAPYWVCIGSMFYLIS